MKKVTEEDQEEAAKAVQSLASIINKAMANTQLITDMIERAGNDGGLLMQVRTVVSLGGAEICLAVDMHQIVAGSRDQFPKAGDCSLWISGMGEEGE